jgi:hypothetical protein
MPVCCGLLREGLSGNPARAAGIAGRLGAEDRPPCGAPNNVFVNNLGSGTKYAFAIIP